MNDKMEMIICQCGKQFISLRCTKRKYCSDKCRNTYRSRKSNLMKPEDKPSIKYIGDHLKTIFTGGHDDGFVTINEGQIL